MKKTLSKIWANALQKKQRTWQKDSKKIQLKILFKNIKKAKRTQFGKDHYFHEIRNYQDYKRNVPIQEYEAIKPYINTILEGEKHILWPKKPIYFAKTSGTTSGAKYIPITKESMPFHIKTARNALLQYIYNSKSSEFLKGKMIFLQGNPTLETLHDISIGRLSGIVAHFVPSYLQKNRMPSWETNTIDDWETKLNAIVKETLDADMRLISGIPPWIIMYFEALQKQKNKPITEIFPHLELMVTGGVNYEPYRTKMIQLLGKEIPIIQTFPASEGFFAYQDRLKDEDLLLQINSGIFYEFVPLEEIHLPNPTRLMLDEVNLNKDYALIISTNAGLWSYSIGDTVRFTSLKPYRIIVSGRTKHFTSAFGEHVIAYEVEKAMENTLKKYPETILEFTMAPQVNSKGELPFHEWFIEFENPPKNITNFAKELDNQLRKLNIYYDDLIKGKVLQPLKISLVKRSGFVTYMKETGKLGGQNKPPRLSNDRLLADKLYELGLII